MSGQKRLAGMNILLLEDDYYLATDAQQGLEDAGATVVGPFREADEATSHATADELDCAVLDINLGDGPCFGTARALRDRNIPFLFITGYDQSVIPAEFSSVRWLEKPVREARLIDALHDFR